MYSIQRQRFLSETGWDALIADLERFGIDACDCANGMKIVEIHTLNSSGFYAADIQRRVLALELRYATP
ncbi:hypothetical protein PO883_24565 [Massilia sp. DJPM01]|uniref:hypothetical protein n=1 Tax=Massilia sp. DJPM01 TaxID=3024404 RepID=UPI00259E7682|nr:hypothetical protein [Massilia sp. DJPM01]MDM5180360.1 hypothetical protein [Massilia sp. DJPM01]